MERKRHREWGDGSTFYIEVDKCLKLRKNYDQTTLNNGAPCIKHSNACIGLIILRLNSPGVCEFFTDNRSALLDGQLSLCTSIVHVEFCTHIFTDVDVIELILLVIVLVAVIAVAVVVVIAIVVTVAVLAAVAVTIALQVSVITNAVTVAVLAAVAVTEAP